MTTKRTATQATTNCRRCRGLLVNPRSVARRIGPTCERNERREHAARETEIAEAVAAVNLTAFKDPARVAAKAEQLLLDDALIATRVPGQYLANGSDGVSTYLTDTVERSCTCKAGSRHGRCNHLVAAHAKNLLDQVDFTLALVA